MDIEEKKEERNYKRKEKLSSYVYDLSKLVFAGLVIGGLSPLLFGEVKSADLVGVCIGIYSTYILASIANDILKY